MHIKNPLVLAGALALAFFSGCSGDDDASSGDGGPEAGAPSSGGNSGTSGSGHAGTGGNSGTGSGNAGAGSGSDRDGGSAGSGSGGSGSSTDGGPSGSSDAGNVDGGVTTDGGSADGGVATMPGCAGLSQCCAALTNPERMGCELLAQNADDAMCDQLQLIYCMPDPNSGGSETACMDLDACCETLPRGAIRVACATAVMNDVALDCEQLNMALCPEGGDPNACADLTECCDTLPPPMATNCNALADQGLASACEAVLPVLCP